MVMSLGGFSGENEVYRFYQTSPSSFSVELISKLCDVIKENSQSPFFTFSFDLQKVSQLDLARNQSIRKTLEMNEN